MGNLVFYQPNICAKCWASKARAYPFANRRVLCLPRLIEKLQLISGQSRNLVLLRKIVLKIVMEPN